MTAAAFVAAAPVLARAIVALAATAAALLIVIGVLRRPRALPAGDLEGSVSRRQEACLLLVILATALLTRLAGAREGLTAPFWFAEIEPLYVAKMLRLGTVWEEWWRSLANIRVVWLHDSPLTLPVAVGFQRLLGPSFHLPLVVSAFYGTLAVLLAWAVGRAMHSRSFGLVFAAFVAASPLQLVWSRLGGLWVVCVPQVLLVLWCSYQAGRRGSLLLALLAGLVTWTSFYYYYAARVAIPLGLLALLAGAGAAHLRPWRTAALCLAWAVVLVGVYAALRHDLAGSFWPQYVGYVGSKGEQGLGELVTRNALPVAQEAQRAMERYFLYDRTTMYRFESRSSWFRWDVRWGGLCLAPVALLGALGLVDSLRRLRHRWLWFAALAVGLAIPSLSFSNARRLLVFDLAWCAFASFGLLALLRARPFRTLPFRATQWTAIALPALVIAWSFASVIALNAVLPRRAATPIPFGEAGFGDGVTCLRCMDAARAWQSDIARGDFVVSVDSDVYRENRTSPGGLGLYGKLAAVAAGRPENFVEFYSVVTNLGFEPPDVEPYFDSTRTDFASHLIATMERAHPQEIVWHFEAPTAWERWLAGRLAAAGGRMSTFDTPLGPNPGIQVRTPWSGRKGAVAVLRELAAPWLSRDYGCPKLSRPTRSTYDFTPLKISAAPSNGVAPVDWLLASGPEVIYRNATWPYALPSGFAVEQEAGASEATLHLLSEGGLYTVVDLPSQVKHERAISSPTPLGLDCAVRLGEHWWVVDPRNGRVFTTDPDGGWVPQGGWTGIARGPRDQLVLASSDHLVIFDYRARTQIARFPATVWPSRRFKTGECSTVLAGDGWYGTFSHLTSLLSVYDARGRPVGHRRLDRLLGLGANHVTAVGATDNVLGVGYGSYLATVRVTFKPRCTSPATGG